MYQENDYVVYKTMVYQIQAIKANYYHQLTYYQLKPLEKSTLILHVSIHAPLRLVMSAFEVIQLFNTMKHIQRLQGNARELERAYKKSMLLGSISDLLQVYMTAYFMMEKNKKEGKKITHRDWDYYEKTKKSLYDEFSIALNMNEQEIEQRMHKMMRENMSRLEKE